MNRFFVGIFLLVLVFSCFEISGQSTNKIVTGTQLTAALLNEKQASPRKLRQYAKEGYNAVALLLEDSVEESDHARAANAVLDAGLQLFYWIEVARNPALAQARPELMASIQTHEEWRRHFPKFPPASEGSVVKTFPWVPALYDESFDEHLDRIEALVENLPRAKGIFLNDLQGAPSACGCGNSFCRWTTDYGPKVTAKRLGPEAAALFVAAVQKISPGSEIVPVWTTECAEQDGGKDAACAGVGCFNGACWKEYARQIGPVAAQTPRIGVLLPLRDFPSKESKSESPGAWQEQAVKSFWTTLPAKGGPTISAERLVAVVQGWEADEKQVAAQLARSKKLGVSANVVAFTKIDQSWEPRLFDLRSAPKRPGE